MGCVDDGSRPRVPADGRLAGHWRTGTQYTERVGRVLTRRAPLGAVRPGTTRILDNRPPGRLFSALGETRSTAQRQRGADRHEDPAARLVEPRAHASQPRAEAM